jgi:hypothetical protein
MSASDQLMAKLVLMAVGGGTLLCVAYCWLMTWAEKGVSAVQRDYRAHQATVKFKVLCWWTLIGAWAWLIPVPLFTRYDRYVHVPIHWGLWGAACVILLVWSIGKISDYTPRRRVRKIYEASPRDAEFYVKRNEFIKTFSWNALGFKVGMVLFIMFIRHKNVNLANPLCIIIYLMALWWAMAMAIYADKIIKLKNHYNVPWFRRKQTKKNLEDVIDDKDKGMRPPTLPPTPPSAKQSLTTFRPTGNGKVPSKVPQSLVERGQRTLTETKAVVHSAKLALAELRNKSIKTELIMAGWKDKELEVLDKMSVEKELPLDKLLLQALRTYQMVDVNAKEGWNISFVNDKGELKPELRGGCMGD